MKKLLALSLVALTATAATAGTTWLQYSIWSPGDLMLPWERSDVYGIRLDMPYGNNKGSLYGLDLGFVGYTDDVVAGIEATMLNNAELAKVYGLQFGLFANRTKAVYGLQLGSVNWNEDSVYGMQFGLVNFDGELYGVQFGLFNRLIGNSVGVSFGGLNFADNAISGLSAALFNYGVKDMTGLQLGFVNLALETSTGVQVGFFNASRHHEGLQFGLINFNETGFLPCLPFFNFHFTR